jgi:hypothetical protein
VERKFVGTRRRRARDIHQVKHPLLVDVAVRKDIALCFVDT